MWMVEPHKKPSCYNIKKLKQIKKQIYFKKRQRKGKTK